MREYFGFPDFRDGQEHVLTELADSDVLAIMPTGSGKSMCYVLPALATGRTLVVSPLIALMQDQVESLAAAGVPAGFINSTLDRDAQNRNYVDFIAGRLKLLYVAPERFANDRFVDGLRGAGVSLLAIDEAHCVSEWGHDFRPDYLLLGSVRERLGSPRTLALTATAEPTVQRDIAERLGIAGDARWVITSVERPNLKLAVAGVGGSSQAKQWLLDYLKSRSGQSGIVYVRTRKGVEEIADTLRRAGVTAAGYHAGMSTEERATVQRRFTLDEVPVMVATNAFGLGVNKADIRFVVHLNMPGRIEAYYQEAGRAGRDGDPAECTLLYDTSDERAQQFFIDRAHPDDEGVRAIWRQLLDDSEQSGGAPVRRNGATGDEDGYATTIAALRDGGLVDSAGRLTVEDPDVAIDMQPIRAHRRYAEDRLGRMVEYAESSQCRRMIILEYFGEHPAEPCGACDNCLGEGESSSVHPTESLRKELTELRSVLADRYRRDTGDILDRRTISELAAYRPRTSDELLAIWGIGEVKSRWFGDDLLRAIREWEEAHPDASPRLVSHVKRKVAAFEPSTLPVDDDLYRRLTEWRGDRARRDGVPAYVVFSNKTLREIAALHPADECELSGVWGVGRSRVDHYGYEVLAVINENR